MQTNNPHVVLLQYYNFNVASNSELLSTQKFTSTQVYGQGQKFEEKKSPLQKTVL